MKTIVNSMKTVLLAAVATLGTMASAYTIDGYVASDVTTLDEIRELVANNAVTEIVLANSIALPDGTDLDLRGRTVRVPTPYLDAEGKVNENSSAFGVFTIDQGSTVHVANGTLMGGTECSACVSNRGKLRMENVTLTRSQRGLCNDDGDARVVLKSCAIVRNAHECGGGMVCSGGSVTVLDGCSLTENRSTSGSGGGGAAEIQSGTYCFVNNSVVANNSSTEIGGAFNVYGGTLYLINSSLCGNVSTLSGGAIGNNGGIVRAVNCMMVNNFRVSYGEMKVSDIGLFSGQDVELTSCILGGIEDGREISRMTDCRVGAEYNDGIASAYREDGVMTGNGETTVSFPHPIVTATDNAGAQILYPPMKVQFESQYWTYFDASDPDSLVMAYSDREGGSLMPLGSGTKAPAAEQVDATRVVKTISGSELELPIVGSSDSTDKRFFTVRLGEYDADRGKVSGVTKFGDSYAEGAVVTVKALPNSGWELKAWTLDGVEQGDSAQKESYSFTVGGDMTVAPVFGEESPYAAPPVGMTVTYNGYPQVGVLGGSKYTVTGNIATEIGKYTATATLLPGRGYSWTDGTTEPKSVNWRIVPSAETDPDPIVVTAECTGPINLRQPIVVAPLSTDELTYSVSQWGRRDPGASVSISLGIFGGTEPVQEVTGLKGEGVTPFAYPAETGHYVFAHEIVEGGQSEGPEAVEASLGKVQEVVTADVFVAWQVGADDPESVYAYDRGDGEIVIAGNGRMTDFDGCGPWGTDITGVVIEDGVQSVGADAFRGCTAMTHVELPGSMETIGDGAFAGDTAIETIRSDAEVPPAFDGDPFTGVAKEGILVYVRNENLWAYEASEGWNQFSLSQGYEGGMLSIEGQQGMVMTVTVDDTCIYEGTESFSKDIPYGSKVVVTVTADEGIVFPDGSSEKTFTWNFWTRAESIDSVIRTYSADWTVLRQALLGVAPEDLRGAITCANEGGTNVITLLRDISTTTGNERTLVVTNAAAIDLAGHDIVYANRPACVIRVGGAVWSNYGEVIANIPGWLKIGDTVGGGRITQNKTPLKAVIVKGISLPGSFPAAGTQVLSPAVMEEEALDASVGGLIVREGSACFLEGGSITGCGGYEIGGVHNAGTLVLKGGEIADNVSVYNPDQCGIVNGAGAKLVITAGKVRDGISNEKLADIEISGGYFGTAVTLNRGWFAEGYESVPNFEFEDYDKKVVETPEDVAEARANADAEIEQAAGLPMTRSDEMDAVVAGMKEALFDVHTVEEVNAVLAEGLAKIAEQDAKDNVGVPQTLTATGRLDLRTTRELPEGVDTVSGIAYSGSLWGDETTPAAVTIAQMSLDTGKKTVVAENLQGESEGASVKLVGQDNANGHKLFHAVGETELESFVAFFFSGFEPGCPSNPWEAGEPSVLVYTDDDPNAEPGPGKALVIEGEGTLDPCDEGVAWNDLRGEITEIFVASGVVLKTGALAGYPNLQRIVFEDPNYRLPHEAMDEFYDEGLGMWVGTTWPSDGVYVMRNGDRQEVTLFCNESGDRVDTLETAWMNGFDPIVVSTVPRALVDIFPQGTEFEPIIGETGDQEGWKVTVNDDLVVPLRLPDNLGDVVIDLNGHDLVGLNGAYDGMSEESRNGQPAVIIVPSGEESGEATVLEFVDSDPDATPDVVGGRGEDGSPAGNGGPAVYISPEAREDVKVYAGPDVTIKGGAAGTGLGEGSSAGEPGTYGVPEDRVEAYEGGAVESGDASDAGVTPWAKFAVTDGMPLAWLRGLPEGVSRVNGEIWIWRRVGDQTGPATFDFNELPLATMAAHGVTSLDVRFAAETIEVDTIKAPVNFSFRFTGEDGGEVTPTLVSVTGKSVFDVAGEYAMETQEEHEIIIGPVVPAKRLAAAQGGKKPAVEPVEEKANGGDAVDAVITWEDLAFTCGEAAAADRWGGAIRMEGGAMRVVNCTFTDCFADDYGGAIFAFGLERDSSVTGCRFENCRVSDAYGYGGAIYASAQVIGHLELGVGIRFAVNGSTFVGNTAVNGGAICTMRDANVEDLVNEQPIELFVSQSSFLENTAKYDGGAIFAEGPVTVDDGLAQTGAQVHGADGGASAVRKTAFSGNVAGGSGGAIAMDCVVGEWFVPAKLSIGSGASFRGNMVSNAYDYALGGAIAHLQPGATVEIFGAKFLDNKAVATGENTALAYALGGAVYAEADATVSLEKTRFFGNWAVSESAYAYGGAGAFAAGTTKVTACSFDDNGVAAPEEYYGGALDFSETTASVKDSTFRASNVEAVDAYAAALTFTNCVIVGNATLFGDEWADVYVTDTAVDVAWTAYGSYLGEGASPASFDDEANHNLPASTTVIYDPAPGTEPWLCPTGYVAAAALGLKQTATDINSVAYGSRFWGYSMGAYECHTMRDMNVGIEVTVDPEEFAWTGSPIEPHAPVHVYDTILESNLVEGVDYTLTWTDNVNPTDRAVVTAIGTERDYIFSAWTNFWITAYYVDSYRDDETEPFKTEMYGELSHTNVTAKIVPPAGYAYDPISSMPTGTVRRYDGECPFPRNGQLTLTLHFFRD